MKSAKFRLNYNFKVYRFTGILLLWLIPFFVPAQNNTQDTSKIAAFIKKANQLSSASGDSGIFYFQKAIKLADNLSNASSSKGNIKTVLLRQLIKAELGLGLIYYQNVDYSKALEHYQLAYKSAKVLGRPAYLGECLFNFGEVYLEQSLFQQAMSNYTEAVIEFEKVKDKPGIYWCFVGMGIAQKQCGNFTDAVICYEKALAIATGAGMKLEVAYCFNNLGNVYRQQGNFVKSMDAYEKALLRFNAM